MLWERVCVEHLLGDIVAIVGLEDLLELVNLGNVSARLHIDCHGSTCLVRHIDVRDLLVRVPVKHQNRYFPVHNWAWMAHQLRPFRFEVSLLHLLRFHARDAIANAVGTNDGLGKRG